MVMTPFRRRMVLLASAVILVVALQLLPGIDFSRARRAQDLAAQNLLRIHALDALLLAVDDAQTGQRGYILTGDDRYLGPYNEALVRQSGIRETLRHNLAVDDLRRSQLDTLERLADGELDVLRRSIDVRRTQGFAAALALVTTREGQSLMEQIRGAVSAMRAEESGLFALRNKQAETSAGDLSLSFRLGGVILTILLIFAGLANEREIASRQRSVDSLTDSEQRFRTLADAIPQLCWVAHGGGDIFWYNQRWYDFTGTTLEQMKGWGWKDVHDPEILPKVLEGWKHSIEAGKPFEMVFPLRSAAGKYHTFLTLVMPLLDRQGKVIQWFGTNTDISAQRKTEQDLRDYQDRLRLAQQVAHVGTFEWDLKSGENRWTPELEAVYGLAAGSFDRTFEAWKKMVHPDDRERAVQVVERAWETGNFEGEWRVAWPDGTSRWIFARAWTVRNDAGEPERMVGVNIDITERKKAELEVLRLNADLEQRVRDRTAQLESANKELEAFAYSVSHDLRAPLRGIDGWSMALLEDYAEQLDEGARKYLDRVRSETQRMGALIDDMLNLSRVSRSEMNFVSVNLSQIASGITSALREANPQRAIEFTIQPQLLVRGDAHLLGIALTNLLSNAVKFTGKRGTAAIEFGKLGSENEATYFVRDNGAGFDMTYADLLFKAFQRLHKASEFPGTGVGLATVQRIIGRHGGRIWAESRPNLGATFFFTLEPS